MISELCPWDAPQYLIISENVSSILLYSHFTAILACVAIAFLIGLSSVMRNDLGSRVLLLILILFSLWAFIDVVVWATNHPGVVLFGWAAIVLIEPLIFISALYLFFIILHRTVLPPWFNVAMFIVLLPLVILAPTDLNVSAVNTYDCTAIEGPLAQYYTYLLEVFAILIIIALWLRQLVSKTVESQEKTKATLLTIGLILFLAAFSSGNIIGSATGNWDLAQYGLFGMPIFAGFLAYLIVRFHLFNLKLIGAQALILSLWVLIGSMLFVAQSTTTRLVAGLTLFLVTVFGYVLVKSVKREVEQREEIAKLADTLAKANERLKILDKMKSEFVSIASHQLRSPLTSIRGYASMLLEGSYGKLPDKAVEAATNIADSAKYMALSVEDYLNVSRIEAGNMKYEYSDFNLKDMAEKIVDEMRQVALKKGLVMMFRSDSTGSMYVHADIGKTRQIIMNLLDNSMKYTPKGTITVIAHDDVKKKKAYVTIHDTGVGMSKETLEEVFDKFVRAKNANNVNTTGTGLGLYVAKKMITDMKGKVWAESEGEGKGSQFHIEFPMISGPKSL